MPTSPGAPIDVRNALEQGARREHAKRGKDQQEAFLRPRLVGQCPQGRRQDHHQQTRDGIGQTEPKCALGRCQPSRPIPLEKAGKKPAMTTVAKAELPRSTRAQAQT